MQHQSATLDTALNHLRAGDIDQAGAACRAYLADRPQDGDALRVMGDVLYRQRKPDEAIDYYIRALEAEPDDSKIHVNLGAVLMFQNRPSVAAEHFRKAIALDPDWPGAHFNLATALHGAQDGPGAEAAYRKAIELDPSMAAAYINLSAVLQAENRLDEAAEALETAIEIAPEVAEAHLTLGLLYQKTKRPRDSIEAYGRGIMLTPDRSDARYRLAMVHYSMGDYASAAKHLRRAVESDPRSAKAHYYLGVCCMMTGSLNEALDAFDWTCELTPDWTAAQLRRASALNRVGNFAAAIQAYRDILEKEPDHLDAKANLVSLLAMTNQREDGIALARDVLNEDPDRPGIRFDLVNMLISENVTAKIADYTNEVSEEDLTDKILVACMPKSGSSFLSRALCGLTGYGDLSFTTAYHQNEQEIDAHMVIRLARTPGVVQQHCRATEPNVRILQAFKIRPVVLVRDVCDALVSFVDFYDAGAIGNSFFKPIWSDLDRAQKIDLMIDHWGPWYANFYASWRRASDDGRMPAMWVRYEDMILDKPGTLKAIADHFEIDAGIERCRKLIVSLDSQRGKTRFNKGVTGRGRKEMTDEQQARVQRLAGYHRDVDFSPVGL